MLPCEPCQQHLLTYLYDLLEPDERREMQAHLESCAACQEMLNQARQQQGLLAEAVRGHHPDIVFKAPAKTSPASTQPTVLLTPPSPRRPFYLNRWAVAASILLMLFAGGGVLGWTVWKHQAEQFETAKDRLAKAKGELHQAESELDQKKGHTQTEIRAIHEQIDALFQDWQRQEDKTRKVVKQLGQLRISGPQVAQAGAMNTYGIQLQQRNNDAIGRNYYNNGLPYGNGAKKAQETKDLPGGMPVQVRAINERNKQVLYEKDLKLQENAMANFSLPQDLPIKPGDQVALEFQMQGEDGKPVELRENLRVVFPEYVTHLVSDRTSYAPGDTVRFRSLTLERFSLKPAQEPFHLLFRIVGPNQQEIFKQEITSQLVAGKERTPVKGPDGQPVLGLGVGEYTLPADVQGGQYHVIVSEVNERFHEEKRPFLVQRRERLRFTKELQFHRPSYNAGDQVRVNGRVTYNQGTAPGGRNGLQVSAKVVLDGMPIQVAQQNLVPDNEGRISFEFPLPVQILKGVGTVALFVDNGSGNPETLVRPIPLTVRDLHLEFFPEGGDLIAGVPNRVYFQARTPAGKPIDLRGRLTDNRNQFICGLHTLTDEATPGLSQGQGSFTFTPQANRFYTLHVEAPLGIERPFPLPGVKTRGVVLHLPQGVVENDIPLTLTSNDKARELMIGAYCRGRLLAHTFVNTVPRKPAQVTLKPTAKVGGVYRITVFEKLRQGDSASYRPVAERLIYRQNLAKVEVRITSDKPSYQPRERVEIALEAHNEKDQAVAALATVMVVDRKTLGDEEKKCSMPTHFLLTTEVRHPEDLENADALLGPGPQAAQALDLLLGCQGWRRFAEQDPAKFQQQQLAGKMPVFLNNAATVEQFVDSEQRVIEQVDRAYVAKAIELQKKLAEKEQSENGPAPLRQMVETERAKVQSVFNEINQIEVQMQEIRVFIFQFGLGGALLVLLFIGFFLISVGLQRLAEGRPARTCFTSGFGLLILLFLLSIIGTFALMGERMHGLFHHRFNDRFNKMAPPVAAPMPKEVTKDEPAKVQDDLSKDEAKEEAGKEEDAAKTDATQNAKEAKAEPQPSAPPQAPEMQVMNEAHLPGINPQPLLNEEQEERQLRQKGNYLPLLQRHLGRRVQLPPAHDPGIVRVYAHQHPPQKDESGADRAATLYWNPALALDQEKQKISFDLADALTHYEVLVLSHTLDGRLGANRFEIAAKLPFSIETIVPPEVTNTDQIALPLTIRNDRAQETSLTLSAKSKGLQITDNPVRGLNLPPNQRQREFFHVQPSILSGTAIVRFQGKTAGNNDTVERRLQVVADGFPASGSISGILENALTKEIAFPSGSVPGTLEVKAHLFPTPLAEFQYHLDALEREPTLNGEHLLALNDLGLMMLQTMKRLQQVNPALEKRARQLLQSGYQKLKAFDSDLSKQPDHEARQANIVRQLHQMTRFLDVEPALLQRHEQGLLERVGKIPDASTRAYVLWTLGEAGVKDAKLDQELNRLRGEAATSKDPYLLALVSLSYLQRKQIPDGQAMLKKLREFQQPDGRVAGAKRRNLDVETTALTLLGWYRAKQDDEFQPNLLRAYSWLCQQRRPTGFGSDSATLLALQSMNEYLERYTKVAVPGGEAEIALLPLTGQAPLNNPAQQIGIPLPFSSTFPDENRTSFSPRTQGPLTLSLRDLERLPAGNHSIQLSVTNNNALPYLLSWSCRTLKPNNDPKAALTMTVQLSAEQPREGESIKLTAKIANHAATKQRRTVAVIGLPAGVILPTDKKQLNALKTGTFSAWELRDRELYLSWHELPPGAKVELELEVRCQLPGLYRGPASRIYATEDAEHPFWVEPLHLRISEAK